MSKMQKNKDPERWLLYHRNGQGPSTATSAIFKAEAEGRILTNGSLVYSAEQSLGPGGRKLKTVDSGRDLFGDDDDGDVKRKRRKDDGADGDIDEQVYEEDFADDEEKMEEDGDEEEAKELEVRICTFRGGGSKHPFCRSGSRRSTEVLTSQEKAMSMNRMVKMKVN
jgi:transcription initiation factor TFIIF subunit alpha